MSRTSELIGRRRAVVAQGVGQFAGDVSAASASFGRLTDIDGAEWIDLAGGIGVMNVGHCHPEVVAAIQAQAARLIHASIHVATYEPYVALCEKLVELLPHGGRTKAMLVNSGAEAVENAIKIARQATGRPAVLCFSEAFHGRTLLCASLTSKTGYKTHCGPFAPEVYRLPFPNRFRYGDGLDEQAFVARELGRLEDAFVNLVPSEHLAAVIVEPVQGEGGFVVAPREWLRGLRSLCDEHGILLICDEVQSGFGRTGAWASYEHFGVVPDLSTWAKSMGGGMPISAVLGRAEVMDAARPGTLGGTYGGNPVACAAALATIAVMEREELNARACDVGARVREALLALQRECGLVADVRGLGAMVAAEFCHDGDPRRPATAVVQDALRRCREQRVLAIPAGPTASIVRILAPLTIDDRDLDRALQVLTAAVREAAAEVAA